MLLLDIICIFICLLGVDYKWCLGKHVVLGIKPKESLCQACTPTLSLLSSARDLLLIGKKYPVEDMKWSRSRFLVIFFYYSMGVFEWKYEDNGKERKGSVGRHWVGTIVTDKSPRVAYWSLNHYACPHHTLGPCLSAFYTEHCKNEPAGGMFFLLLFWRPQSVVLRAYPWAALRGPYVVAGIGTACQAYARQQPYPSGLSLWPKRMCLSLEILVFFQTRMAVWIISEKRRMSVEDEDKDSGRRKGQDKKVLECTRVLQPVQLGATFKWEEKLITGGRMSQEAKEWRLDQEKP